MVVEENGARMKKRKREPRLPTTINLPASFAQAEALTFAGDFIAAARNSFEVGDPFNLDSMHGLVRRTLKHLAELHPRNAARIVEFAIHGFEQADQALRDLITERKDTGAPLGAALATYSNIISERPSVYRRPHSRPRENFLANFVIVVLLIELMRRFGLRLRRSSHRHPSACSVAAEALTKAGLSRGSEEAIRKIWERYGPPVVPGYGWNPKNDQPRFLSHEVHREM
jgi:hypothetical protein